ncbi:MAG: hypothetical protein FJX53_03440 [Alphaproteobacteria bacterium]|nr:hypothetical protein [Alphaproteobacteria bacterium]
MSQACKAGLASLLTGAALLAGSAVAATPAKTVPPTTAELAVINVRALQSDLMVAALACDRQLQYHTAVARHVEELARTSRILREMFERSYGDAADTELDRYVTLLANWSSQRGMREGDAFCRMADSLFDAVMRLDGESLAAFLARMGIGAPGR